MSDRSCVGCEADLTDARPNRRWCSEACRVRSHRQRTASPLMGRTCRCGKSIDHRPRHAKFCSPQCRWRAAEERRRQPQDFECGACGKAFTRPPTRGQRPKWCPGCRNPWKRNPELVKYHTHLRRSRMAATGGPFTSLEIFERDGWQCGICGEPVDRELRYPDPLSASIDHIVPLSKGGEHTPENVRCSHLECNVRRGNRIEEAA